MIFEIKGEYLEVLNEIEEFDKLIYGRLSQFKEVNKRNVSNFLKFKRDSIEISIKGIYKLLNNRVIKTDIYPIINNVIAYLINDKENMFIHGMVVSKSNKGILIVGDFGQGKTTLAEEFEKHDYEINSTDQTWIELKNNGLCQKIGSRFDIKKDEIKLIDTEKAIKKIEIEKIIRIIGLCDNGKVFCKENTNIYHNIKNLSYFCNWNYIMPIFTDEIELYNTNAYIKQFLNKLVNTRIQIIEVRGDKTKILQELEI